MTKRFGLKCVETGDVYESSTQLASVLGVHKSTISNHIAGRSISISGLTYIKIPKPKREQVSPLITRVKRLEAILNSIRLQTNDESVKKLIDKSLQLG